MANTPTYLSGLAEAAEASPTTLAWSAPGLVCPETEDVHKLRHERLIEEAAGVIQSEDTSEEASLLALSLIELEKGWSVPAGRRAIYHVLREYDSESPLMERAWSIARKMNDPETHAILREISIYSDNESNALEILKEVSPLSAKFVEEIEEQYLNSDTDEVGDEEDLDDNDSDEGDLQDDELVEDQDHSDSNDETASTVSVARLLEQHERLDFESQARDIAFDPETEDWKRDKAMIVLELLDATFSAEEELKLGQFAKFGEVAASVGADTEEEEAGDNRSPEVDPDDEDLEDARSTAVRLLSKSRGETSLDALSRIALFDQDSEIRLKALDALSKRPESFAQEVIVSAILDEDEDIAERVKSIILDSDQIHAAAEARLYNLLLVDDESVRRRTMECFGVNEETLFPDEFMLVLEKGPDNLRNVVAEYASQLEEFPGEVQQRLIALAKSSNPTDRSVFIKAVGNHSDDATLEALAAIATKDRDSAIRNEAIRKVLNDLVLPNVGDGYESVINATIKDGDNRALELLAEILQSPRGGQSLNSIAFHLSTLFDRTRKEHVIKTIFGEYLEDSQSEKVVRDILNLIDTGTSEQKSGARTIKDVLTSNGWREVFIETEAAIRQETDSRERNRISQPVRVERRKGFFETLFG